MRKWMETTGENIQQYKHRTLHKNEKMNGDNRWKHTTIQAQNIAQKWENEWRQQVKTYNNTSTEHWTTVTNIFCDMTNEFWNAEIFEVKLHDQKIYNDVKLKWWHYWLKQTKSLKMLFGGRDQQS